MVKMTTIMQQEQYLTIDFLVIQARTARKFRRTISINRKKVSENSLLRKKSN